MKYEEALNLYLRYKLAKPKDKDIFLPLGICYFETNDLPNAEKHLRYLLQEKKNPPKGAYYFLGKITHSQLKFDQAIQYYKQYLRKLDKDDERRAGIKDDIRRCASGLQMRFQPKLAVIENLGAPINTPSDDFKPILSPTRVDKLYFSSRRPGNLGGMRNPDGKRDVEYGRYSSDIFSARFMDGRWQEPEAMSSLLNSPRHDVIFAFDEAGQIMYFFKSLQLYSGQILVDTFRNEGSSKNLFPDEMQSPMQPKLGDKGLCLFHDTLMVFASAREGGYGGFDLYFSSLRAGQWLPAVNMGPTINTPYDEVSPTLAEDGMSLYFSSNNISSMGGFDVFKAVYSPDKKAWLRPTNVGSPINSAGDDLDLVLAKDGYQAFLTSTRKEGLGRKDIYIVYFQEALAEQINPSQELAFSSSYQMVNPLQEESYLATNTSGNSTGIESRTKTNYEFGQLFYDPDSREFSMLTSRDLDEIAALLKQMPNLKVLLQAHAEPSQQALAIELYFSIKKAEEMAKKLIEKGVLPDQIIVKGSGGNYPIAKQFTDNGPNTQSSRWNNRVVPIFTENDQLLIKYQKPKIFGSFMEDSKGRYQLETIKGLSYGVQMASSTQLYRSPLLERYPDASVEKEMTSDLYLYTVGLYSTFSSAYQLVLDLQRQGITDPFVVPYYNGVRMDAGDIADKIDEFSDLQQYLRYYPN